MITPTLRQEISDNTNSLRQEVNETINNTKKELIGLFTEKNEQLGQEVKNDMIILRKDLTIRLGLMMSSSLFILVTLMKLFHL